MLLPLTGLRGVAAYSVLLAHAIETFFVYRTGAPVLHGFDFRLASFGMSLFFTLSGFVLFFTYAERLTVAGRNLLREAYGFFVARFARLYPLYIFGLIVYAPHGLPPIFKHHRALELSYATLTQSWFNAEDAFFPPDWSISTEWFFYLMFIPLSLLIVRIRRQKLALAIFCAVSIVAVYVIFGVFGTWLEGLVQQWLFGEPGISAPASFWLIYFDPPLRLLEFTAGMLAANAYITHVVNPDRGRKSVAIAVVLSIAVLYCLSLISFGGTTETGYVLKNIISNFAFAPALSALLLCVCLSRNWLHRVLSTGPFQFMGDISYSVYMWSFLVLRLFPPKPVEADFKWRDAMPALWDTGLEIALTTLLAYGSYHLVEAPARKWVRVALMGRWRSDIRIGRRAVIERSPAELN